MAFYYALRYDITATCLSPMRSADAGSTAESLLQYKDGAPFLQAASIAGALRAWLEADKGAEAATTLFGSPHHTSTLIVSDGVFDKESLQATRPRLKIDEKTKTADAKNHAKFDITAMVTGSIFRFTLLWTGNTTEESQWTQEQIERVLSALNSGEIMLGANKTNGYGRVSIQGNKQEYNMKNAPDREAWLSRAPAATPFSPYHITSDTYVIFTVTVSFPNVLTKGMAVRQNSGNSFAENMSENGKYLLSGATVKGAIRAHIYNIATNIFSLPRSYLNQLFGANEQTELAGKALFSDAHLDTTQPPKTISRIRINRFSGNVMHLFSEQPLSADTKITIRVPKEDAIACGLILFALRDMGLNLLSFGSGYSVGRGYGAVKEIVASNPDFEDVRLTFGNGATVVSGQPTLNQWLEAIKGGVQ